MIEDVPRWYVVVEVPNIDSVREWCWLNIPELYRPELSVHETTNNEAIVRATFINMHYASLFRMFWDHQ